MGRTVALQEPHLGFERHGSKRTTRESQVSMTTSDEITTTDHQPYLGNQLRSLRTAAGYSIAQVAAQTGLSSSFLSLVESGRSDISIGRMIKLANFYRVGFSDLLPTRPHLRAEVIRAGQHPLLEVDDDHMDVRVLTEEAHRTLQPVVVTFAPGGHTNEYLQHDADVVLYVIDGELTLEIEESDLIVLQAGDSVYLDPGVRRKYRNAGAVPVTYMGVVAGAPPVPTDGAQDQAN
jgi:transcriptional regulator with XRE-family HTH domain